MATIQSRPFSKNYSGLTNQSVIAGIIFVACITFHEVAKRKRRGKSHPDGLGSVESWQFGYLYQGRCWAKKPSPPSPNGWPLSWVKEVVSFPEERLNELRGVDATLYCRFLRGCKWFMLLHCCTTLAILLPIHVTFSGDSVPSKSMTRASISSLVLTSRGLSLLWIHLVLLIWITLTWMYLLYWLCCGAFHYRAANIMAANGRVTAGEQEQEQYSDPGQQSGFTPYPPVEDGSSVRGLRLRTVMVTNIPSSLRSEKDIKEYFEYYLSREIAKPTMGITTTTQPGFFNKVTAFLVNRARGASAQAQPSPTGQENAESPHAEGKSHPDAPVVDRVVIVRKMNDLASLLERREEVLRLLETAHIKLAKKVLGAVVEAKQYMHTAEPDFKGKSPAMSDLESAMPAVCEQDTFEGESRMSLLVRTFGPYVPEGSLSSPRWYQLRTHSLRSVGHARQSTEKQVLASPAPNPSDDHRTNTVWDALLSLPRSTLDPYQPLIHLSALFRGQTVPSIDYYTAKLDVLTSLIAEKRAMALSEYQPMSTAFVTFADPVDARRACKYLAVHPANPMQCFVTMAPALEDLDWKRLMKPTFRVEFVKDWVVNAGVWAFTIFWVFPVSIFVGLVSIQNISAFWPGLSNYLNKHAWEEELLQSFIPTLLVALLSLLIPLLLLLIAKKAHTLATKSEMHDTIMTRYYKWLVVNVLVFFCVGTVALQSFLVSFTSTSGLEVIQIVADSFPTAGPFYVGWLIFTMAMHGGFELALFGLPLLMYPATQRQLTPRKRAQGIRPRTFNYYYWMPNHILVIHVILVFSVLNPLVIPFGFLYFCVESIVVKNQLLHVYAKDYEGNGQNILIRIVRYSLDGLTLSQAVFLAYMVVIKNTANVAVSAILICMTVSVKLVLTRFCRARFERDDVLEAQIVCGTSRPTEDLSSPACSPDKTSEKGKTKASPSGLWTSRFPIKLQFSYATIPRRPLRSTHRERNPFQPLDAQPHTVSHPAADAVPEKAEWPSMPPVNEWGMSQSCPSPDMQASDSPQSEAVKRHPPHPAWDDEPSISRPYNIPYYTLPIEDALWLPRDPMGILDLDDTVLLQKYLTSQPTAGTPDTWSDNISEIALSSASLLASETLSLTSAARRFDGTEQIELSPDLALRVHDLKRETDVESTTTRTLPSRFARRTSGCSTHTGSLAPPRRHASSQEPRSFSLSPDLNAGMLAGPSSFLPSSGRHRRNRSVTLDHELGLRTQARFAARSAISVVEQRPQLSLGVGGRQVSSARSAATGSVITTREAVVGEALVEEKYAAEEQLRREEVEEERARETRSWFTAWMYTKGQ